MAIKTGENPPVGIAVTLIYAVFGRVLLGLAHWSTGRKQWNPGGKESLLGEIFAILSPFRITV